MLLFTWLRMVAHYGNLKQKFKIPRSTLHKQFLTRLKEDDYVTFIKVKALLDKNKFERSSRGGESTRKKFIDKH